MWLRSALNGDTPFVMRMVNTRKVSNIGPINMANVNAGALNTAGVFVPVNLFSSINLKAITAEINPMSKDPVSPINILAGDKLNFRKPAVAPTIASETAASS